MSSKKPWMAERERSDYGNKIVLNGRTFVRDSKGWLIPVFRERVVDKNKYRHLVGQEPENKKSPSKC